MLQGILNFSNRITNKSINHNPISNPDYENKPTNDKLKSLAPHSVLPKNISSNNKFKCSQDTTYRSKSLVLLTGIFLLGLCSYSFANKYRITELGSLPVANKCRITELGSLPVEFPDDSSKEYSFGYDKNCHRSGPISPDILFAEDMRNYHQYGKWSLISDSNSTIFMKNFSHNQQLDFELLQIERHQNCHSDTFSPITNSTDFLRLRLGHEGTGIITSSVEGWFVDSIINKYKTAKWILTKDSQAFIGWFSEDFVQGPHGAGYELIPFHALDRERDIHFGLHRHAATFNLTKLNYTSEQFAKQIENAKLHMWPNGEKGDMYIRLD